MSVTISSLGITDEEYAKDLLQQAAARRHAEMQAAEDAAKSKVSLVDKGASAPSIYKTSKAAPAAQVTPYTTLAPTLTPTPGVVYTPESAVEEPYYARGATDLNLPPLVRAAQVQASKSGIPWKTVGIVAGVVAVGGLVTYMLVKTSRGFRRPAMAGFGRVRRRRR